MTDRSCGSKRPLSKKQPSGKCRSSVKWLCGDKCYYFLTFFGLLLSCPRSFRIQTGISSCLLQSPVGQPGITVDRRRLLLLARSPLFPRLKVLPQGQVDPAKVPENNHALGASDARDGTSLVGKRTLWRLFKIPLKVIPEYIENCTV